MNLPEMTSNKPYLIRALYEWIMDNHMTPYIVVDVNIKNIKVPMQFAQDGKIVFNISSTAALKLQMDNDYIRFSGRFSGSLMEVVVPTYAVLAIYAKETGGGMAFQAEQAPEDGGDAEDAGSKPPYLKRVK